MLDRIRQSLTRLGEVTAHPAAFALIVLYALLWFAFDRKTLDWHALATLATLFMTLFIQRAEHRDTQALQAKLDELLRVHGAARNELIDLDQREPEEIDKEREARFTVRAPCGMINRQTGGNRTALRQEICRLSVCYACSTA